MALENQMLHRLLESNVREARNDCVEAMFTR